MKIIDVSQMTIMLWNHIEGRKRVKERQNTKGTSRVATACRIIKGREKEGDKFGEEIRRQD